MRKWARVLVPLGIGIFIVASAGVSSAVPIDAGRLSVNLQKLLKPCPAGETLSLWLLGMRETQGLPLRHTVLPRREFQRLYLQGIFVLHERVLLQSEGGHLALLALPRARFGVLS
jgi:hypothetical protein